MFSYFKVLTHQSGSRYLTALHLRKYVGCCSQRKHEEIFCTWSANSSLSGRPSSAKMESQLCPIHCLLEDGAEGRRQSLTIGKTIILHS